MKDFLFSYYDISYKTDLGLTERRSQALQKLAQGFEEAGDTIDSLASKTGIRPILMIGLIRSKGNGPFSAMGDARRKEIREAPVVAEQSNRM